jgi:hypothetical protein
VRFGDGGAVDATDGWLEQALRDLGSSLDPVPGPDARGRAGAGGDPGRGPALVDAVLARIEAIDGAARSGRAPGRRVAVRIAVAAAVVLAVLIAVTPTRDAMAGWFGIGGVRITTVDAPLGSEGAGPGAGSAPGPVVSDAATPPASSPRPSSTLSDTEIASSTSSLPFTVLLADPAIAGGPLAVTVDPTVPTGLVEIRYEGFTLVELASQHGSAPVVEKFLGQGTSLTRVDVGASPGFWLSGEPHEVVYLDPDGEVVRDSVRRAGDVLVWADGGVTYRIEGASSLDLALRIATTLR